MTTKTQSFDRKKTDIVIRLEEGNIVIRLNE